MELTVAHPCPYNRLGILPDRLENPLTSRYLQTKGASLK